MKIGIFGGSFNPPHNMHKNIMLELLDKKYIDKGIYVPTGDNYNKKDLITFLDRFKMVGLMIKDNNSLLVSDIGNSMDYQYTYQVLDYFQSYYKDSEIYFICGSDNLLEFDTWREYSYILNNYKLLVIRRNNNDMDMILDKFDVYRNRIVVVDIDSKGLSSTYLRENIDSQDILNYLDNDIYKYIRDNGLYNSGYCKKKMKCD